MIIQAIAIAVFLGCCVALIYAYRYSTRRPWATLSFLLLSLIVFFTVEYKDINRNMDSDKYERVSEYHLTLDNGVAIIDDQFIFRDEYKNKISVSLDKLIMDDPEDRDFVGKFFIVTKYERLNPTMSYLIMPYAKYTVEVYNPRNTK